MTPEETRELVEAHAPVLWLHRNEAFHPVDAQRMLDHCDVYRARDEQAAMRLPVQPITLAALAAVPESRECYLKLPPLDPARFRIPDDVDDDPGYDGPSAVMRLARARYGRRLYEDGVPVGGHPDEPRYYARVADNIPVVRRPHDPRRVGGHPRDGRYVRIEYHFFFVYNDAWNQHQGDWDSTVVLYLRKDGDEITSRGYLVVYMHHERWACRLPSNSGGICDWLHSWQHAGVDLPGSAYVVDGHPFIFIAQGAHGGYPTPGHTLYGFRARIPGIVNETVLFNTDERELGAVCIAPPGVDEGALRGVVADAGIADAPMKVGRWGAPGIVKPAPDWFGFDGLWGEPSPFSGWSGPDAKRLKRGTTVLELKRAMARRYESGAILENWHGIASCEP